MENPIQRQCGPRLITGLKFYHQYKQQNPGYLYLFYYNIVRNLSVEQSVREWLYETNEILKVVKAKNSKRKKNPHKWLLVSIV